MHRGKGRIFIAMCLVVLAGILLRGTGAVRPIENALGRIVFFVSKPAYRLSLRAGSEETHTPEQKENLPNETTEITRDLLERENKDLREQLHFFARHAYIHIGADVIGKSTESFRQVLLLNRGTKDGVREGQAAIVKNGILLGKIIRAEDNRSFVQLVSDYRSIVGASLISEESTIGVVEGGAGMSLRMGFIPQDQILNIGDTIVTSGLDPSIPRGLLIGKVAAVEKEPYEPFQRAIVTPLASMTSAVTVSIILEQ